MEGERKGGGEGELSAAKRVSPKGLTAQLLLSSHVYTVAVVFLVPKYDVLRHQRIPRPSAKRRCNASTVRFRHPSLCSQGHPRERKGVFFCGRRHWYSCRKHNTQNVHSSAECAVCPQSPFRSKRREDSTLGAQGRNQTRKNTPTLAPMASCMSCAKSSTRNP